MLWRQFIRFVGYENLPFFWNLHKYIISFTWKTTVDIIPFCLDSEYLRINFLPQNFSSYQSYLLIQVPLTPLIDLSSPSNTWTCFLKLWTLFVPFISLTRLPSRQFLPTHGSTSSYRLTYLQQSVHRNNTHYHNSLKSFFILLNWPLEAELLQLVD